MRDLFFYGTLRHLPLLEIVLGRSGALLDVTPGVLADHAVRRVAEGPFPTLLPEAGANAQGVLLRGLTEDDVARLDFYEGSFAYDLVVVTLADGRQADVYFPQPDRWTPGGRWSLAEWETRWADLSCRAAREVMGYFGNRSRDEVAQMFPMIRARAWSEINAAQSHHGAGTETGRVEVLTRNRSYARFFALDDFVLRHSRFDGMMSAPMTRAVFVAADAAIVLPYDPVRDRVMVVEQMRMGPLARGDRSVWQLEPIAGRLDPGETPEQTAHREAAEEAGLTLHALEKIAEVYPSSGNSTEFHYIFLGLADLPDGTDGTGGLDSENEDIKSHVMPFDVLMALVDTTSAANAPLVLAANWLARHRDRLRSAVVTATP